MHRIWSRDINHPLTDCGILGISYYAIRIRIRKPSISPYPNSMSEMRLLHFP